MKLHESTRAIMVDTSLVPSRSSVCAVINGKGLSEFAVHKGKEGGKSRSSLSFPPKRHCGRQIAFPYLARINKWQLGPSLGGYRSVAQSVALRSCAWHRLLLFTYRLFSFLEISERSRKNKNRGGFLNDHWRKGFGMGE